MKFAAYPAIMIALLLAGLTITGLGQVWLFSISATGSYQVNVLGGVMVTAFGMGLAFPTASVAVKESD